MEISNKLKDIKDELEKTSKQQTTNNNKNWTDSLDQIIKNQNELLLKIESATDVNDFKKIKEIAIKIKKDLEKLTGRGDDDVSKIAKMLLEKENELIEEKNNATKNTNELNIKLSISAEKIKMTELRLIETDEKLQDIEKEIRQNHSNKNTSNINESQKQEKELKDKISNIERKIKKVSAELDNFNKTEQEKKDKAFSLQDKIQEQQIKLNYSKNKINELMIELTRLETRKEDLEREVGEEIGSINALKKEKVRSDIDIQKIHRLKSQLELIGGIDPETMTEYKETKERYNFLTEQVIDLEKASDQLEKIIENLDKVIKNKFDESFVKINKNFNKYFKILFNGGDARLVKSFREVKEEIYEENEDENNDNHSGKEA